MKRISKRRTGGFVYSTGKTRTYTYIKPKSGKTRKSRQPDYKSKKSIPKTV